jgi:hypothetical protein
VTPLIVFAAETDPDIELVVHVHEPPFGRYHVAEPPFPVNDDGSDSFAPGENSGSAAEADADATAATANTAVSVARTVLPFDLIIETHSSCSRPPSSVRTPTSTAQPDNELV